MPPREVQYSFSHGEVSEEFLGGRLDVNRYYSSCRTLEGYLPLLTGGVTRAPGTRFIAETKSGLARLVRFEFSITQAYILEVGPLYMRFFTQGGRLEEPVGTPVEVVTPYFVEDLFQLQFVQSADVLYIVHPRYQPRKLLRLTTTSWELRIIVFHPAPALEFDFAPAASLTLSALTGTITLTAGSAVFLDADVDRIIVSGPGAAVITGLTGVSPTATATALVLEAFSSTTGPLASGTWFLTGSPVADCTPSRLGPAGSRVTLSLSNADKETANLLTMTGWTDLSGPTLSLGTATGGSDTALIDTTKDFLSLGVQAGHRVQRTLGGEGRADNIATTTNPFDTVNMNPGLSGGAAFGAGNAYTIRQTGSFITTANQFTLSPGENGLSWGQKQATVINANVYELEFTVHTHPVTVQIGTTSTGFDLFAEASFSPGAGSLQFTASGTAAFVQFRNAQSPNIATVTGVKLQLISVQGWRSADVTSVVQIFGGSVEITSLIDATRARGIIWWPLTPGQLDPTDPIPAALAGAWTLNQRAWTTPRGFPRTISFYQGRLAFGGSPILGIWLSANGLFETLALGTNDDQAIFVELLSNKMNAIEWMEPLRDLLVGTRTSEHSLRGGQLGITPSAIERLPLTTDNGSEPFRPVRMNTVLYQLGRGGRTIYEVQLDQELNQVTESRDLLVDARHLTVPGSITQWAVQNKPIRRLWMIRSDGQILCFTADLTEGVRGFARRVTQGQFRSVETLPIATPTSDVTEEVWVVAERQNGHFIERMEPSLSVDSALSYSGVPVSQVSGLSHLRNQVVAVINDGAVETKTVSAAGVVTLDHPGTAVTVGLSYTPKLHLPRVEIPLREGTMQGLRKRIVKATVRLLDSMGLTINGEVVPFRRTGDVMDTAPPLRDEDISALLRGWTLDGLIDIEQPLPFASTITLVQMEIEFEETR